MSEQLIINVNVTGEEDLDKIGTGMEKTAVSTKKAASEITNLRKQIKEAKSDMLKYAEGTAEYNAALNRAAQASFRLRDVNDKTKLAVRDFGQSAKNVSASVSGMAAIFGTVSGAVALFGIENETTLKTIQNLTAGLAIVQGLGTFADSIDSMRDLYNGLKASGAAAAGATSTIGELTNVVDENTDSLKNTSKESAVLASNMAGVGVQAENNSKLTKELVSSTKKYTEEEFNALSVNEQRRAKLGVITEKIKENTKSQNDNINVQKEGAKATEQMGSSIGKTMLTMGLITVAITAVIWSISKLIEWMNKIPEDVKIKIDVENEAIKKTTEARVKIKEFQADVQKAQTEHNNKQLKFLEEYAKKEFGLVVDLHKMKSDDLKIWAQEYLEKIQETYYKESLIKRGVDEKVKAESALNTAQELYQVAKNQKGLKAFLSRGEKKLNWNDYVKMAQEGTLKDDVLEALTIFGIDQQIIDNLRAVNESNKAIKEINRLYRGALREESKGNIKSNYFNKPSDTKNETKTRTQKEIDDNKKLINQMYILNQLYKDEEKLKVNERNKNLKVGVDKTPSVTDLLNKTINIDKGAGINDMLETYNKAYDQGEIDYLEYLNKRTELLKLAYAQEQGITQENIAFMKLADEQMKKDFENAAMNAMDNLASVTDSFANIYDTKMTITNQYYDAEAARINGSVKNEQVKNKKLEQLEKERYKSLKKDFDRRKNMEKAGVYLNLATGLFNTYVRAVDPKNPLPTPFNFVEAGIEAAALIAQSIASISAIDAQTLDSPSSSSSSSSSSSVSSVALNPTKTTMTSQEENLNTISKNNRNTQLNVVKVSEINEVQKNVNVTESYLTY